MTDERDTEGVAPSRQTWRDRFADCLVDYIKRSSAGDDYTSLLGVGSLDDYIDGFVLDRERAGPALALRALAVQAFERFYYDFERALNRCGDSPLEFAMLLALTLVGRDRMPTEHGLGVYFGHGGRAAAADDYEYITIEPQAEFGSHRVDFLVTLSSLEPADMTRSGPHDELPEHVKRAVNEHGYVDRKIVVECDGHDFHDRTRTQASRDRARDRALQTLGLRVFRYTGSDIWRDVMRCAAEVIDALQREMREVWHEADAPV